MIIVNLAFRDKQRGVTKHLVKAVRSTAGESNYLNATEHSTPSHGRVWVWREAARGNANRRSKLDLLGYI